ncbi:glycosyltransferase [Sphingobacterium pedocola]|uniref:Glycosyl transferase group 1 n=1 Tax=Sphingobacterium pedocola TaxID=2082722 RepID=A0ABR9TBT3_9SPHI|nr:glycosyltransferase [Sphingobacterium pedocola]MBE8722319.1 glycosyl transferase group 1 [Sphingobacterium pedocola]
MNDEQHPMTFKKILYFFPLNPLHSNAGSVTRARGILTYFRNKGYIVDFVNSDDEWGEELTLEDRNKLVSEGLARSSYGLSRNPPLKDFFGYLRYLIPALFLRKLFKYGTSRLTDYNNFNRRKQFNTILKRDKYDYIIISYAYWANLIKDNSFASDARLIIDTHDWLTAQDQSRKRFEIGKGFSDEIERLNLFDEIWTVSSDEQYVFEQFCRKPVHLIPIGFQSNFSSGIQRDSNNVYFDAIYVASDNMHNIKACNWFFRYVYPSLPKDISFCIIGTINKYVPDLPNVTKVEYVEDLNDYYYRSKLAICPMLSGTGVKIKVIEALSYGLPVVCNRRGVDGLVNKTENGCVVTDDGDDFSRLILRLLRDNDFYEHVRNDGQLYFNRYHSIEAVYRNLDSRFV